MKNLLSIAAVIVSGIFFANTASAQTNEVKVNVIFKDFVSIKVNDNQKEVNLVFETMDHYANGVEENLENHLTVASTKGYTLNVKSTSPQFSQTQGSGSGHLNLNNVSIAIADGGSSSYGNAIVLDQSNRALKTSTDGTWKNNSNGIEKSFNVSYRAKGQEIISNQAIARELMGKTFTGDVVYTITTN